MPSMLASARAKSVEVFSITEHVSQFNEPRNSIDFGSVHETGRVFQSLKEYNHEFSTIPESSGFTVRRGLEVDFSPRYEGKVGDYVNQEKFDILLCSVHELEDRTDVQRPKMGKEPKKLWLEYLDLEKRALESDFVPFDVLTHPVRMIQGVKDVPEEFDFMVFDLAKIAKKRNKALELNGSDLSFSYDLVRRLALACKKAGCKVSLGSDAHFPRDVYRNMEKATVLANELGLEVL
jgi:histidinol-phosphatase (PHP family)